MGLFSGSSASSGVRFSSSDSSAPLSVLALPKIDLHLHLDGALRPQTILDLAEKAKVRLPARSVRRLQKHITVSSRCRSLAQFLRCFQVFLPVLKSAEAMERAAYELCEDQARDGVVYFETRFAPILQARPGFPLEASVEAALAGLRRGGRDFGVRWGLILCALRDHPPSTSMATARAAAHARDQGVVGFDIANDERRAAAPHRGAFDYARRHDLPVTVHAGESGPAANIREAITRLNARRIGHGVRVVDDPELLDQIIEKRVTLEMCLTSNLQTRSVRRIQDHPLPRLLAMGAAVTLNTDDPAISRITLSREYKLAAKAFALTGRHFARLYENAVDGAFASASIKRALLLKRPAE
ncbi:MAG: adenosine deaminase [Planctomycetes bacterium]|nr:adenosine deaminase [Planctomycetota bacterium]